MNRDEAQFILRGYRADSDEANEPPFQAAFALMEQDRELTQWFEEEQALDAAFRQKIRASIPVPPDLKHQLLLARSIVGNKPWWNRRMIAAAAAMLLLIAVGSLGWRRLDAMHVEQFRAAMVRAAQNRTAHSDVKGLDAETLRRWLALNGGDADFSLPPELPGEHIAGCKIVSWRHTRVTMLCIWSEGTHADLFVMDASQLPGVSRKRVQRSVTEGEKTTLWCWDHKLYLLVEDEATPALKRMT